MVRRVYISGLGEHPENPPVLDDWEIWATAQHDDWNVSRFYQIHTGCRNVEELQWLIDRTKELPAPVYMVNPEEWECEQPRQYPLAEVMELTGAYLECSIAYMLAHAILEHVDEVYIARVGEPFDEHYQHQRSCIEYLIGFARGRGIKVSVQSNCALLKSNFPQGVYGHAYDRNWELHPA